MKRCPECLRDYLDDTLLYCLDDGNALLEGPASRSGASDEPATAILHSTAAPGEAPTRAQIHTTEQTAVLPLGAEAEPRESLDGLSERQSLSAHRAAKPLAALVLAVLALIAGFFGYKFLSRSTTQINSIAVLPFENRSGNADSEYLSDGLAESLIYRLSQLPDLKVSPTSSVFRYKGKETDPQVVAKELGVDSVMTGRITQRGDNLTISVNLVDTRNGKSLWGEQYERKMSELLTTQREIASEITSKLQLKLSGEGEQKLTKKYTDNNEAYQLYLKGRYYWNKRTEENLNKAIEQFKAAADKDPSYALAYAGLADCYSLLPFWSNAQSSDVLPQAKAYATQAVSIDDSIGEAHISLAFANHLLWDWPAAEREYKRGLELNPNYATGHKWYGQFLMIQDRFAEALTEIMRAQELEPLSLVISFNLAERYLAKGDTDAAAQQCKRAIELDPDWFLAHRVLALSYVKQGRNEAAVAEAEKAVELSKSHSDTLGVLGYVLARTGKRSEALQIAEELKTRFAKQQAKGIALARVHLGLNEKDEAFGWLEKDFENHNSSIPEELVLYPLNELRDDPRYAGLLKRMVGRNRIL